MSEDRSPLVGVPYGVPLFALLPKLHSDPTTLYMNLYQICDQFLNCTSYTIWLYGIESMLNQISYQSYAIQLSLNETLFDK